MKAIVDDSGQITCLIEGDIELVDAAPIDVPDDTTIEANYVRNKRVYDRKDYELKPSRFTAIDGETVTIRVPKAALVKVNGVLVDSETSIDVTESSVVTLAGTYRSQDVRIRFMSLEEARQEVRDERNARLTECDWTQMPDNDLSGDEREAWRLYRGELRDLPAQQPNVTVESAVWPERPE